MNDRPPVVQLRASLSTLVSSLEHGRGARIPDDEIRAQVCAVVDDLRSLGWQPERVIIAMKELASDAGLRPSRRFMSVRQELERSDELLANIVRWTIERYYHEAPLH